jgi:hypothetical protein
MNPILLPILGNLSITTALLMMVKIFFIIGGSLYFVFSLVAIRQISIMRKTLITPLSPLVTLLGYIHLVLTLGALAFFWFLI